jgi:outer membrane protein TolC
LNETDARIELAQQLRPDLHEALLRAEQQRLETIVTRNGVLPRLDFFIGLGRSGYADTFSDSFRELDGNNYDLSAGFRFSSMIGNRAAKARDLAAAASRRQSAEAIANLRQLLRLDVRLAVNEVERARRQIEASRTRKLEEKTVQAELERFNVGAGTSLLVARAQRDLVASRIAEVRAVVDYRRALVDLYLAEGSLMARRGIAAPDRE